MKLYKNLSLITTTIILTITLTSCVNCLRTNDESYYLSLQDKKINQVSEQVQKKYLKNNTSEVTFTFEPTNLFQEDIRASNDEGCYSDWCEQSTNNIYIDGTDKTIKLNIRSCMNNGLFEVHFFDNANNYHQSYYLINQELQDVTTIASYNSSVSTFLNFTQDFLYKNTIYKNVLVFKNWNTVETNYIIIEPDFNLLLLEHQDDEYKLTE